MRGYRRPGTSERRVVPSRQIFCCAQPRTVFRRVGARVFPIVDEEIASVWGARGTYQVQQPSVHAECKIVLRSAKAALRVWR